MPVLRPRLLAPACLAPLLVILSAEAVRGQVPFKGLPTAATPAPTPTPTPTPSPTLVADAPFDSPRSSMAEFLDLTRRGKYAEAADFLDLGANPSADGKELARRLRAVLDRSLWIDLDSLSAAPLGDEEDGQAPGVDLLGAIVNGDRRDLVRIVHRDSPAGGRWVFSRATVSRIDTWYETVGDSWARKHLPDWLLRMGAFRLLRWQWLALLLILPMAYVAARALGWPVRAVLTRFVRWTQSTWDDALLGKVQGLWTLTCMLLVVEAVLPWLEISAAAQPGVSGALRVWGLVIVFALLLRGVDVIGDLLKGASFTLGNPSARSALSIATRTAKVAVVILGILAGLLQLGYPVASILAGVGIGGLGLALAAQKTVENLFGSVSLAADEAIRLGDTVRVDNLVGQVEGIGLRSTRLRTPERTVVTIPNGLLAGQRIESLTARDRMRLNCRLGLVYSSSAEQVREVLAGCERVLRAHERIWPHDLFVRFVELGPSSMDIEVTAWFVCNWDEFTLIRQQMLLAFLEVVDKAKTSLAYPTTTLVLPNPAPSLPEPPK
jgi:MscS family membrane protein